MTFSSSKVLKMEAYDAAVLSYALATAASKIKPGLLGIAPNIPARLATTTTAPPPPPQTTATEESLTPPSKEVETAVSVANAADSSDSAPKLEQLLSSLEQNVINKSTVQLSQLMEICSAKQNQVKCIAN